MIGIVGKLRTGKRYMPLDYKGGCLVGNVIYSSIWDKEHTAHVTKLVAQLNADLPLYNFKIKDRTSK